MRAVGRRLELECRITSMRRVEVSAAGGPQALAAGLMRRKDMNSLNHWKQLLLFVSINDLLLRLAWQSLILIVRATPMPSQPSNVPLPAQICRLALCPPSTLP